MTSRGLPLESLAVLGLASLLAISAVACRSLRPVTVRPVSVEASRAFAEAREAIDAPGGSAPENRQARRDRARAFAREALAAEPDWVAPARLLDDLDREELRGVEALAARRERLAHQSATAGSLYLAGRLEGQDGERRFERAADLDPGNAWARHGLAWSARRRGHSGEAIAHERAALVRARDSWERLYFAASLVRFLAQAGRFDEASAEVADLLAEKDSAPADRLALELEFLGLAMERIGSQESHDAYRRALDLLREQDLPESAVEVLVEKLRILAVLEKGSKLELSTALAARPSPARDRLRAELMLASGPTPLALGLLERSHAGDLGSRGAGPLLRAARFAAGEYLPAVDRWLADLPVVLRDREGLPRDPRLARIVRVARTVSGPEPPEAASTAADAWFDLGEALLDAGWFREARALAGNLARADLDRALTVENRAAAGMQLLEELDELIGDVDSKASSRSESARAGQGDFPGENVRDLEGLLEAVGPRFARFRLAWGETLDPKELGEKLAASPRLRYGPIGQIVHPGPAFSAEDDRQELGPTGAPVPGLARAMDSIGRFALVGELSGSGGPDGTILSKLFVEERGGEHLGVRWAGTVVWCEGADVRSRLDRSGARISAAALHEGYWLDVQAVRGELGTFEALAADFGGEGAPLHIEEVIAAGGLPLEAGHEDLRRQERSRVGLALGEASRVRLAVLRDRAEAGSGRLLGEVRLDELARVTAIHEEGHLTDRTRYLPFSKHWPKALGFLLDCGFSPQRVAERLEYRAQLVALCESPDPRIPLAQALDAVETDGRAPTPHAAAYEDLLEDFVGLLDERLAASPGGDPEVDPDRTLVHQLHRLRPEKVREIARQLAGKKGMAE